MELNTTATINPSTSSLGARFIGAFMRQLGATMATATGDGGTTITVQLPSAVLADRD